MRSRYRRTVELLLDITPQVFGEPEFAMKGGTAINLFVQDLPRLSVDIDLVFVPKETPRDEALERITAALTRIQRALTRAPDVTVIFGWMKAYGGLRRTLARGLPRVQLHAYLVGAAYNLLRLARLRPLTG
jgi:hypothetical protein